MSYQEKLFPIKEDSLPYQAHSETSKSAAISMEPTAASMRAEVWRLIKGSAGLTDEQQQMHLEMNPSTQRPRRIELVQAGKVRDSGRKRKTQSGRWATVWEAVP